MRQKTTFLLFLLLAVGVVYGQRLSRWNIRPASYSGITSLGGDRYAVVDDKQTQAGFAVWQIRVSAKGKVEDVREEGIFTDSTLTQRDEEDVAFCPWSNTLFCSGEADQRIVEHQLTGKLTGKELAIPTGFSPKEINGNCGFESVCVNAKNQLFWTVTESALKKDATGQLRLLCFDKDLQFVKEVPYTLSTPQSGKAGRLHIHGISSMTCLPDGSLLVLEREARIASHYIGSRCWCQLYRFDPQTGRKGLVTELNSKFNLTNTRFANYEGVCLGPVLPDGRQTVILINDSEGGYGRALWHLRDRIKIIIM